MSNKVVTVSLSPAAHNALREYADLHGVRVAEALRHAVAEFTGVDDDIRSMRRRKKP
jgi:hypothetical protein